MGRPFWLVIIAKQCFDISNHLSLMSSPGLGKDLYQVQETCILIWKLSWVFRGEIDASLENNFDYPNQPHLLRQSKTHIAFSMFPILDTYLWALACLLAWPPPEKRWWHELHSKTFYQYFLYFFNIPLQTLTRSWHFWTTYPFLL